MSTSGSTFANRSSRPTDRGTRRDSSASRCSKIAATCLKARYCISRANSRSRASSRARSSSSSRSADGSSRTILRSSSVAATTRNCVVCSSSHSLPSALTCAMNSSVTRDSDDLGDVELMLGDQLQAADRRGLRSCRGGHRIPCWARWCRRRQSSAFTARAAAARGHCPNPRPRRRPAPGAAPHARSGRDRRPGRGHDASVNRVCSRSSSSSAVT